MLNNSKKHKFRLNLNIIFCVILEYTVCTTFHLQQSKSNILRERKKIKRKRVRETKEVRENEDSVREKKRKNNLMRNTDMKKKGYDGRRNRESYVEEEIQEKEN